MGEQLTGEDSHIAAMTMGDEVSFAEVVDEVGEIVGGFDAFVVVVFPGPGKGHNHGAWS